jgi:plastocyanin
MRRRPRAPPPSCLSSAATTRPVAGTPVDWAVTGGAASVNPASSSSDATGVAQTAFTFGATPGPVTATATSGTLTGSPVTFHATVSTVSSAAAVQVGDFFFKSSRNNSQNPAVDTIAVGGTVTWTWVGAASHSVQSLGSPSFTSSTIKTSGTYAFTFNTAGTYTYDCAVHGASMTGIVIVQ